MAQQRCEMRSVERRSAIVAPLYCLVACLCGFGLAERRMKVRPIYEAAVRREFWYICYVSFFITVILRSTVVPVLYLYRYCCTGTSAVPGTCTVRLPVRTGTVRRKKRSIGTSSDLQIHQNTVRERVLVPGTRYLVPGTVPVHVRVE